MRIYNGTIYLTTQEIQDGCNLEQSTLYKLLCVDSLHWQAIKDPEDRRCRLIRFDSLSPKYQAKLKSFHWNGAEPEDYFQDLKSQPKQDPIIPHVLHAHENYHGYLRYYTDVVGHSDRKTQKLRKYLARAASCTAAIHIYYAQEGLSTSNRKPLIALSAYLAQEKKYLFPKPYSYMKMSVRHMQEALKALADGTPIEEIVLRPREGNENRIGQGHSFIKGALARLLTSGKNPTIQEVVRKVQFLAKREGLPKPSESTIHNYVAEMNSLTAIKRFGESSKAAHKFRSSIPLARAMHAGDCWEMDGTRVQLQPFQNKVLGKRTELQYLYVVGVRDVYSGAYLGWSFALAESGLMYTEALKMAVSLTGYLPYELKHDRFPGHNSDNIEILFDKLTTRGVKLTKTSSSNGKAHVERAFGTLQSVFEMDRKEWVGQGIQSSRDYARPTAEYLAKVHKQLKAENFDWHDAWMAENQVLLTYNFTPVNLYSKKFKDINSSPIELHDNEVEKPNVVAIQPYQIAELFWPTRRIAIRNFSIKIEVNRQEHIYMLTDEEHYEIVRDLDKVEVRFDPSDMTEVMIFHPLFQSYLSTLKEFQRIQLYGNAPEYDKLAVEKEKIKAMKARFNSELEGIKAACDADVLSIQIAHLLDKDRAAQAESSAMASYWKNQVPVEPTFMPKKTKKPTPVPIHSEQHNDQDPYQSILNQL